MFLSDEPPRIRANIIRRRCTWLAASFCATLHGPRCLMLPVRAITQRRSRWYTRNYASPRAGFPLDARQTFPILTRPQRRHEADERRATLARTIRPNARSMPKPRANNARAPDMRKSFDVTHDRARVSGITCNAIVVNLRHVVTVTHVRFVGRKFSYWRKRAARAAE